MLFGSIINNHLLNKWRNTKIMINKMLDFHGSIWLASAHQHMHVRMAGDEQIINGTCIADSATINKPP